MEIEILSADSKICVEFISKLQTNLNVLQNSNLNIFAERYIKTYTRVYNNINNHKPNININEKTESVDVYKSSDPHVISYAKSSSSSASNFIQMTGINSSDSIENISEKVSVSDIDTVRDFYEEAKNNYEPILHENIYQHFCPVSVQYEIEQNMCQKKNYNINYDVDNINYKIDMTYFTSNQELRKKFLFNMVIPLITICILANKTLMNISYEIYTTNEKKQLPTIKFLGSHSINTGSTYRGDCETVKLWRQEEIRKVACHELFHCLALDFNNMPLKHLIKLKNRLNISNNTNILLGETYAETWATIINCLNVVLHMMNSNAFNNDALKIFYKYIEYEIQFALFQSAKIMDFFDYEKYKDFYFLGDNKIKTGKFKQNTCVISYYIVKSALLFSIHNFINYCVKYNDTNNIMQFIENDNNYEKYIELIMIAMEDENYINGINNMIKIVRHLKINHKDSFIYKTLRMTCLEF